jgi:hypothetical protein
MAGWKERKRGEWKKMIDLQKDYIKAIKSLREWTKEEFGVTATLTEAKRLVDDMRARQAANKLEHRQKLTSEYAALVRVVYWAGKESGKSLLVDGFLREMRTRRDDLNAEIQANGWEIPFVDVN